jgi:hypothetical protein
MRQTRQHEVIQGMQAESKTEAYSEEDGVGGSSEDWLSGLHDLAERNGS